LEREWEVLQYIKHRGVQFSVNFNSAQRWKSAVCCTVISVIIHSSYDVTKLVSCNSK